MVIPYSGSIEYDYPNIAHRINSTDDILTIEHNNGSSVDITITVDG